MTTEILLGLFTGAVVSGVLPLVNAELLVIAAAAALPGSAIPFVAAVGAAGQMVTKTALYGLARWLPSRLPEAAQAALRRTAERVNGRRGTAGPLVFCSATVGLPPFYGTSLACGALRVHPGTFVASGLLGRLTRFWILAAGGHRAGAEIVEDVLALLEWGRGVVA